MKFESKSPVLLEYGPLELIENDNGDESDCVWCDRRVMPRHLFCRLFPKMWPIGESLEGWSLLILDRPPIGKTPYYKCVVTGVSSLLGVEVTRSWAQDELVPTASPEADNVHELTIAPRTTEPTIMTMSCALSEHLKEAIPDLTYGTEFFSTLVRRHDKE